MSNFVLALTGPTGAGKSTIGEKVAKRLERCVNIDADHIKHMIVSGFYVDDTNPDNANGWGFSEWELVGESIGLLARNFLDNNYDVVINGYIDEPAWLAIEKHVRITYKVLLLPHVNAVTERDAGRIADVQMGAEVVAKHHQHFSTTSFFKEFVTLDTTSLGIDDTVSDVLAIIGKTYENK
jgi:hypothetical protein